MEKKLLLNDEQLKKVAGGAQSGVWGKVSFECNGCHRSIGLRNPNYSTDNFSVSCSTKNCGCTYTVNFRSGRIYDQRMNGVGGVSWGD